MRREGALQSRGRFPIAAVQAKRDKPDRLKSAFSFWCQSFESLEKIPDLQSEAETSNEDRTKNRRVNLWSLTELVSSQKICQKLQASGELTSRFRNEGNATARKRKYDPMRPMNSPIRPPLENIFPANVYPVMAKAANGASRSNKSRAVDGSMSFCISRLSLTTTTPIPMTIADMANTTTRCTNLSSRRLIFIFFLTARKF